MSLVQDTTALGDEAVIHILLPALQIAASTPMVKTA